MLQGPGLHIDHRRILGAVGNLDHKLITCLSDDAKILVSLTVQRGQRPAQTVQLAGDLFDFLGGEARSWGLQEFILTGVVARVRHDRSPCKWGY